MELIPVLSRSDIAESIERVAKRISKDFKGCDLILIGVLKGAFVFLSDLVRHISIPIEIDFIRAASYGAGTSSSGEIQISKTIEIDVYQKDVLLIEDIIDTGLTLNRLIKYVKSLNPKSVKICGLIDKKERRVEEIKIDYSCHTIEKGFLVGYGLDYNEKYRELPDIYHLII